METQKIVFEGERADFDHWVKVYKMLHGENNVVAVNELERFIVLKKKEKPAN